VGLELVVNNVRFPGQYFDDETGLHYNWHRFYDPETGRYISADPIGLAGEDVNLFSYVGQDPINWIDPWGLLRNHGRNGPPPNHFKEPRPYTIGGGFYYGGGMDMSYTETICCKNNSKYSVTYFTICGGVGAAVSIGKLPTPSVAPNGSYSVKNNCPRNRTYYINQADKVLFSANVQIDNQGMNAGGSVGWSGGIGGKWAICGDTIISEKKISDCCDEK
jgi:RHS repeat-associated protein